MGDKHFNGLTPAEAERLALLIEEAGEVISAACKVLRHGYGSHNPDDPEAGSNRIQLGREMGDLQFAMNLIMRERDIPYGWVSHGANEKNRTVWRYLHHNPKKEEQGNG